MKEEEISRLLATVENKIEKVVNGKIIRLTEDVAALHGILEKQNESTSSFHDKVDARFDPESDKYILKDVQGIIEAYKGSKILGEILKWLAVVGAAFLFIKSNFHL